MQRKVRMAALHSGEVAVVAAPPASLPSRAESHLHISRASGSAGNKQSAPSSLPPEFPTLVAPQNEHK